MSNSQVRHLIDSFEERVARLRRYTVPNLISELDPRRTDQLVSDLPDQIDFLQQVLGEAQRRQRERRMARRA